MTDDPRLLSDELHDLASDVATTAVSTARARDRAHRGIVRHRRNQRAAVAGLATVVLAVGVTAAVALDRDSRHSAPPAGETTVVPSTTVAPTPSTTLPVTTVSGPAAETITVPSVVDLPAPNSLLPQHFPWGTGLYNVAYAVPHGEGVSGGPAAFTVNGSRSVDLFDYSNSRILVVPGRAADVEQHIDLPSPAVTAAVFDSNGFVIAAQPDQLLVYGADGLSVASIPYSGPAITRLASYGKTVYAVGEDGSLQPLIHLTGNGYERGGTLDEPGAVVGAIGADGHMATLTVPSTGAHYSITSTDPITGIPAAERIDDGSIVFVLATDRAGADLDAPLHFVLGHMVPGGRTTLASVSASAGYLVNGPQFFVNQDLVGVMGSTTTAGVTVSFAFLD